MMRLGLLGVAALVAGALGAHFLLQDTGYVLINFRSYVIEMSVPVLVALLAAAYLLVRTLARLWGAPRRLSAALAERRHRRAADRLTRALIHVTEGDWRRGERLLTQASRATDAPLVSYLLAARAAQLQGSRERRDEWLARARETPGAATAVLLTQADFELEAGEHEAARAALERLDRAHPDHAVVLARLARVYRELGDRAALAALLPRLGRARLAETELEGTAAEALEHAWRDPEQLTRARIDERWRTLPPAVRKAPAVLRQRALALERIGHGADAEKEVRSALNRAWSAVLVRTYGEVTGADRPRQLRQAEKWLEAHAEDAPLLFTAARLCLANELWGKARSYYESGLALGPEAAAYASYGELLERLGEREDAAQAFESGLRLASGVERGLPALKPPLKPAARGEIGAG